VVYLKAVVVGIVAAVVALALWSVRPGSIVTTGSGGIGAVPRGGGLPVTVYVPSTSALVVVAVIGVVVGCGWYVWRTRRATG
jgi:hypothetical protein